MLRGDRFRALREQHNFTHEELAEQLGLGTTQVWRYEAGKTDPSSEILGRIATVFNVSSDYLIGLTDDPTPHFLENLTARERMVLAAMRRGEVVEAIRAVLAEK